MKCPDCGHENRVGLLLCETCNADLYEVLLERVATRQLSKFQTREFSANSSSPSSNPIVAYVAGYDQPFAIERRNGIIAGRGTEKEGIDLDFTEYGAQDLGVSRRHARFDTQSNNPVVIDLNSTNGVYVNDTRIAANQAYVLRSGDEVKLGRMVVRIYFK